jgi:thiosulfate dehydrogenase [quinone] large subunit
MKPFTDFALAHGLARIGLGVNIALHGWTRVPNLPGFAAETQKQFAASILPAPIVYASAYGIGIGEAVIGTLLLLGLFLRPTLVAGTLLMIFLLTGTCLIQNWNAAGTQLIYLALYCGLLATARHGGLSVDRWRKGAWCGLTALLPVARRPVRGRQGQSEG